MASAETPVPFMTNVDRVVVSCEFSGDVRPELEALLCRKLAGKAQQITDLPVVANSAANSTERDLHIHLRGVAHAIDGRRKSLSLYLVPGRSTPQTRPATATISTVTLQQVRDDWVVLGPVDIFADVLGSAPRSLHRPIASE